MGNHLVAKLAFFPPDPAKYGKDGLFFRARPESAPLRAMRDDCRTATSLSTKVLESQYNST
jgi:hypothetical protein